MSEVLKVEGVPALISIVVILHPAVPVLVAATESAGVEGVGRCWDVHTLPKPRGRPEAANLCRVP